MKIVINRRFGGFSLSKEARDILKVDQYEDDLDVRLSCKLVEMVEKDPEAASGEFARLTVVDIPDDATDWFIDEYDGLERVIYVVNGKLQFIC